MVNSTDQHFSTSRQMSPVQEETVTTGSGMSDLYGVYRAVVVDNEAPDDLARVRVKFPWRDDESGWTRIATPFAGTGMGTRFVPDIDTEVLVAFEAGDIRYPYVIGGLWNNDDRPPEPEYHGVGKPENTNEESAEDEDGSGSASSNGDETSHSERNSPEVDTSDVDGSEESDDTQDPPNSLNRHQSRKIESANGHRLVFDDQFDGIKLETAGGQAIVLSDKYGGILIQDENESHIALTGANEESAGGDVGPPGTDPTEGLRGESGGPDVNPILPYYPDAGGISIDAGERRHVNIEGLDVITFGYRSSTVSGLHAANVLQAPTPAVYLSNIIPLGGVAIHGLTQVGITATSPLGGFLSLPGTVGIEAPMVNVSAWGKYKRMSKKDTVTSGINKRVHGYQRRTIQLYESQEAATWKSGIVRDITHKLRKVKSKAQFKKHQRMANYYVMKTEDGGVVYRNAGLAQE